MKLQKRSARVFLLIQAVLYCVFLWLDISGRGGADIIKYSSIALCLAFSAYWSLAGGEWLITAALLFTLGADTFLLLLNKDYALGVALFIVVQSLYFARIFKANGGKSAWILRLALFAAAITALRLTGMLTGLNALVALYFTGFVCNVVQSASVPGFRLFTVGLALFLCCDICVGFWNEPGLVPRAVYGLAGIGMWLFYLPGQVLITLSGRREV